jgi:class 3 adenylate cyclase/tetratricopeptide (TPR) repeat protein
MARFTMRAVEVRAERRLVTCLFVDVVGSTDTTVRLGPERMQRLLGEAFGEMGATIAEHGGTIEKYVGDAIFALFGAPTAHVNDPERALQAAETCAQWSQSAGPDGGRLAVRIGLETGEALVDLDAVEQGQRMAVGACVNIAARLQQEAKPGQILVGATLREAAAKFAHFESAGTLSLKGLGDVGAWRFLAFREGGARPVGFVGRESELLALSAAIERAQIGSATLALVVGPPGQGKSRLAAEALAKGAGDGALVIQARCRPGAETGVNTPLRQLVNALMPEATTDTVRRRVVELLGEDEGPEVAEAISHSAGVAVSERMLAISRMEQRELIAESWRRFLVALAGERPVIVWVEDLHWADPTLVRVIDHLTSGDDARLLVLATARPEFVGSAHLRPSERKVQIDLAPLEPDAAAQLARMAGEGQVEVGRAAGNPLFIIELARSQSASGVMPMTIQAAIETRLDELSAGERDMVQRASVAGETFDVRDAALLGDLEPAEAAGMLGRVAHLGFVEQVDAGYRFHHALVHDVAYGRLPVAQRMALHVLYAVDGVQPDDVEARAHHWWQAVNPADAQWVWEDETKLRQMRRDALRAQLVAGERMEQRNAYEEAQSVYERAIELADEPADLAAAQAALGRACARQGKGDESWEHRRRAIATYADAGQPIPAQLYADMLEIATFNWGYFQHLPDDPDVLRLLTEGEREARHAGDEVELARLLTERASFTGEIAGLDEVERFVRTQNALKFAETAHRAATTYMWSGRIADAMALFKTVFDRLVLAGAVINEPEALVWYALCAFWAGELDRAEALADRLEEEATRRSAHTRQHALGVQALVRFGRGDWAGLEETSRQLTELVDAHPEASFCLVGAAGAGYGAVAEIIAGRPLPESLDSFAGRLFTESALIQSSSVMLPKVMTTDSTALADGLRAYGTDLRLWDRMRAWDVGDLMPAIALTMLECWDDLSPSLARLDEVARGGGRLAEAAASAVREEAAAAEDGAPRPKHEALHALGYEGISELLSYRPALVASPLPARRSSPGAASKRL